MSKMLYYFVDNDKKNVFCFFFNGLVKTYIYTLSLHDALPILAVSIRIACRPPCRMSVGWVRSARKPSASAAVRSEEHTSELQSQFHLVCRLLLEKKKLREYLSIHENVILVFIF